MAKVTRGVRIIGGQHRGRKLDVVDAEGLRPTTDRVKETVFNWLNTSLPGAKCLDLFAGSGNLGLEALSRGAAHCTFVEKQKQVAALLSKNVHFVAPELYSIQNSSAETFLNSTSTLFNIIFFDPPYQLANATQLLQFALEHLTCDGLIYIESSPHTPFRHESLLAVKEKQTKEIHYGLYQLNS